MFLPVLLAGALLLAAKPAAEADKELDPSLVLAGVVLDEARNPLTGADLAISYEGQRIASFISEEAGWFESPPLPRGLRGKIVNLSVILRGYELYDKPQVLWEGGTFVPLVLQPLEGQPRGSGPPRSSRGFLHVYVSDAVDHRPVSGARLSLVLDTGKEIAFGLTAESGYCTLTYNRLLDERFATMKVVHDSFAESPVEQLQLGRPDQLVRVSMLPKTELKRVVAFDLQSSHQLFPKWHEDFDAMEVYGQNPGYEQVWVTAGDKSFPAALRDGFWRVHLPKSAIDKALLTFHFSGKVKRSPMQARVLTSASAVLDSLLKNELTEEKARANLVKRIRDTTAPQLLSFDAIQDDWKDGQELPPITGLQKSLEQKGVSFLGPTRLKKLEEGVFQVIDGEPGRRLQNFSVVLLDNKAGLFTYQGALSVQETEVEKALRPLLAQLPSLRELAPEERKPLVEKLAASFEELSFEQQIEVARRPLPRQHLFLGLGAGAAAGAEPSPRGGPNLALTLSFFPSARHAPSLVGLAGHLLQDGAVSGSDLFERSLGVSLVLGMAGLSGRVPSEYWSPGGDTYLGLGGVWHVGLFSNLHVGLGWPLRQQPRSLMGYALITFDVF